MTFQGSIERLVARCVTAVVVVASVVGCGASLANAPATKELAQFAELRAEVKRLSRKVEVLEQQLQQDQRSAARARLLSQEQHERIAALESRLSTPGLEAAPASPRASVAATMYAQAELRRANRTLMRAIERMDISEEEKAALKSKLRPTRTLDSDNPWSSAQK